MSAGSRAPVLVLLAGLTGLSCSDGPASGDAGSAGCRILQLLDGRSSPPANVVLSFLVTTCDGQPVGGLTVDQLLIEEDGEAISVQDARPEILDPSVGADLFTDDGRAYAGFYILSYCSAARSRDHVVTLGVDGADEPISHPFSGDEYGPGCGDTALADTANRILCSPFSTSRETTCQGTWLAQLLGSGMGGELTLTVGPDGTISGSGVGEVDFDAAPVSVSLDGALDPATSTLAPGAVFFATLDGADVDKLGLQWTGCPRSSTLTSDGLGDDFTGSVTLTCE